MLKALPFTSSITLTVEGSAYRITSNLCALHADGISGLSVRNHTPVVTLITSPLLTSSLPLTSNASTVAPMYLSTDAPVGPSPSSNGPSLTTLILATAIHPGWSVESILTCSVRSRSVILPVSPACFPSLTRTCAPMRSGVPTLFRSPALALLLASSIKYNTEKSIHERCCVAIN